MNLLKYAKCRYLGWRKNRSKRSLVSRVPDRDIDPDDMKSSLLDPSAYYIRTFQDFHHILPAALRSHREYFTRGKRGFGEDAFHVMWWRLVRKFKPGSFLEIGVYRGQVLSLVSLITKLEKIDCEVIGISPFTAAGDSVSKYLSNLDYLDDTLANFRHFDLAKPNLIKAFSTDPSALETINSREWDMIYIDGNHDYDVVRKDWAACSEAVKKGGLIVMDDSGLTSQYRPPLFSTAGHPGPSRVASEIDRSKFEEILQVGHNRVFKKR